ncbi:MAG: signal peptidase II [Clostridiales bacterium]|nr:signal peptidase II [Clostridiales bacterium]
MPIAIISGITILDQIVKIIIRSTLSSGESLPVIGNFFRIVFVRNTGTSFSMFESNEWITLGLTSVLLIVCSFYLVSEVKKSNSCKYIIICLASIIGGGLSNLLDRLFVGYVTDMFSVGSFAVFNVADIFITCGCIILIVYIMFFDKEDR